MHWAGSPSYLGPPKARIPGLVWERRAPADAHDARACGAHHEVTAAGRSSIIEFAGAAPRRPKTCPNATRNARAFRSHSPADFEFPRSCRRPRRGASRASAGPSRRSAASARLPLKASPLWLRPALGPKAAATEGHAALPDLRASGSSRRPRRSQRKGR